MLEPGVTVVPLLGESMLASCATHAVVKAASKAASVNFMVVVIGEKLELIGSLCKECVWIRITSR
jgi:hypothetical protein